MRSRPGRHGAPYAGTARSRAAELPSRSADVLSPDVRRNSLCSPPSHRGSARVVRQRVAEIVVTDKCEHGDVFPELLRGACQSADAHHLRTHAGLLVRDLLVSCRGEHLAKRLGFLGVEPVVGPDNDGARCAQPQELSEQYWQPAWVDVAQHAAVKNEVAGNGICVQGAVGSISGHDVETAETCLRSGASCPRDVSLIALDQQREHVITTRMTAQGPNEVVPLARAHADHPNRARRPLAAGLADLGLHGTKAPDEWRAGGVVD